MLLCAHQMQLVERLADRVLLMSRGREVLSGTIAEVKSRAAASNHILLRLADETDPAALAGYPGVVGVERGDDGELAVELAGDGTLSRFLGEVASRHEIANVRTEEVSLHDVFVQRVGEDGTGDGAGEEAS